MNAIRNVGGKLVPALCFLVSSLAISPGHAEEPSLDQGKSPVGELARFTQTRVRMGVPFNITVYAPDESTANAALREAFGRIKELNATFSDYDPRSETRQITKNATPGEPISISDDMRRVLALSRCVSQQSNGAFDVTVSPLVKLWRRSHRTKQKPTPEAIREARALVGWKNLELDTAASTVTFEQAGMELDFGAIAKGDACDEALRVLKSHGLTRAMVEAGGDLACGDPPPGKAGWIIAVEPLASSGKASRKFVVVKNQGVATSGDAYQFVEFDGVRYSHIVDPRTGMGLTTRGSVTMIAPTGALADALASAASVLGPEDGKDLVESLEGVEMLMVTRDDSGETRTVMSDGFGAYLMEK